jgi:Zn-dependent protease with chaperone function
MKAASRKLQQIPRSSTRLALIVCMAGYYPFLAVLSVSAAFVAVKTILFAMSVGSIFGFVLFAFGLPFALMVVDVLLALPAIFVGSYSSDPLEIDLPRQWMNGLHALVNKVARKRGVEPPDDVRLHADTVAHVYEDQRGRRILVVGGAAVAAFSQDALAGIIAHELGHFAGGDTRLSRIGMKWFLVMSRLEARLRARRYGWWNPLVWLIRGYHLVYMLAWAANSRSQEYAADRHEVELVGEEVAAAALVLFNVTEVMPWVRLSSIAEACVAAREPMNRIFAEQARRARAASASEWKDACRKALKQKTGAFDTHPCLKDRLKAMGVSPREALNLAVPSPDPPARELFANWDLVEKLLTEKIIAIFREIYSQKMEIARILTGHLS